MTKTETEQHWQAIFQQQRESGLTKAKFCKLNNITASAFYAWAKKLRSQQAIDKQQVVPLVFTDIKPEPEQQLHLTLPNGYQLSFLPSLEPSKLQQFLHVLSV